jgi:hypothetical protein
MFLNENDSGVFLPETEKDSCENFKVKQTQEALKATELSKGIVIFTAEKSVLPFTTPNMRQYNVMVEDEHWLPMTDTRIPESNHWSPLTLWNNSERWNNMGSSRRQMGTIKMNKKGFM